jgi:hypothetical protein
MIIVEKEALAISAVSLQLGASPRRRLKATDNRSRVIDTPTFKPVNYI